MVRKDYSEECISGKKEDWKKVKNNGKRNKGLKISNNISYIYSVISLLWIFDFILFLFECFGFNLLTQEEARAEDFRLVVALRIRCGAKKFRSS